MNKMHVMPPSTFTGGGIQGGTRCLWDGEGLGLGVTVTTVPPPSVNVGGVGVGGVGLVGVVFGGPTGPTFGGAA